MESLNHSLFLLINAGAEPSPVLLYGAIFFAKWLVYSLPVLLLAMWLWGRSYHRELATKAVLSIVLGLLVTALIRWLWPHPRPFVVGLGYTHLAHAPDASFPSNHAVFCFSMAFSLWWNAVRKRAAWILLGVALSVCWARVYLGVHFPLDMVGGAVVVLLSVWLVNRLLRINRLGDRLVIKLETTYGRIMARAIARGWVSE
ncbi:MAG: phosphatase PAP2 family protein [Magnetococcales bacterium]|nr:phosphatase PAP2 family protein [Magnetococcales bacterium]